MPKSGSKPETLKITMPSSNAPEDVEKAISSFPGYAEMSETEKRKLRGAYQALAKKGESPPRMEVTRDEDGSYRLPGPADGGRPDLYALQMMQIFGTCSSEFTNDCLNDLVNYFESANSAGATSINMNSALAFVAGMNCENETEAMLAVQMVKTNDASGRALAMIGSSTFTPALTATGNIANKLLRTNIAQMEAFSKLRRGGEQVVRHIYVDNRGGQNIIAENLSTGSRNEKVGTQSHAQGAHGPEVLGHDSEGNGVPITGGQREETVQDARRD